MVYVYKHIDSKNVIFLLSLIKLYILIHNIASLVQTNAIYNSSFHDF